MYLSLYADHAHLFFVSLLNTLMYVKTRCALSASASQYSLMLLVIDHIYLIRAYTKLIGDSIAVQILMHNPPLSFVSRYPVASESPHAPKLAVVNQTSHMHLPQELSRAPTAFSTVTEPISWYSTYVYRYVVHPIQVRK